jgi:hypothetical protein
VSSVVFVAVQVPNLLPSFSRIDQLEDHWGAWDVGFALGSRIADRSYRRSSSLQRGFLFSRSDALSSDQWPIAKPKPLNPIQTIQIKFLSLADFSLATPPIKL